MTRIGAPCLVGPDRTPGSLGFPGSLGSLGSLGSGAGMALQSQISSAGVEQNASLRLKLEELDGIMGRLDARTAVKLEDPSTQHAMQAVSGRRPARA